MSTVRSSWNRSNKGLSRSKKLRLIYSRPGWQLTTAPRYRYFDSIADAMAYVRKLYEWKRAQPGLNGRIEELDCRTHRWKELPELARLWAEGGWR